MQKRQNVYHMDKHQNVYTTYVAIIFNETWPLRWRFWVSRDRSAHQTVRCKPFCVRLHHVVVVHVSARYRHPVVVSSLVASRFTLAHKLSAQA